MGAPMLARKWGLAAILLVSALVVGVLFSLTACAQDADGAVRVVSVTDGDTIRVRMQGREEPIRLIGINTPELRLRPEAYAEDAHRYAQRLVNRGRVWLEFDQVERDRYGRMLAYVWLAPPDRGRDPRADMLNARLLLAGWAEVMVVRPNVKYRELFVALQAEAKAAGRGIWQPVKQRQRRQRTLLGIESITALGWDVVLSDTGWHPGKSIRRL